MGSRNTILVTGATGWQGGAVARCLLERGLKVRIMTRSPGGTREWKKPYVEVVRGDFDDYRTLQKAVRGIRCVFLMGTPYEYGPEREVDQCRSMVYACMEEGVPQIVYTSVCGANRDTGIPHFDSKYDVEEYVRESGLTYTILRPVSFMENFESPGVRNSLEDGVLSLPLSPETNLQMICVDDIGEFAAGAIRNPGVFDGKEIDLAGDEREIRDAVAEISCAMNHPVRYEQMSREEALERLGYDVAVMYEWLDDVGHNVDIKGLKGLYGMRFTSFSRFLGRSDMFRKAA